MHRLKLLFFFAYYNNKTAKNAKFETEIMRAHAADYNEA